MDVHIGTGRGGNRGGDWRNSVVSKEGVLVAKPHRGCEISDGNGLRGSGGGRGGVAGRTFRGVLVGPRRTDGRVGYPSRFGTVPQLDRRERAGTRQSIGAHAGILPR